MVSKAKEDLPEPESPVITINLSLGNSEGLSPAISIDQKTTSKNPRSTVATVTEIYDYIRFTYTCI
jgi:excinuclease UvrABC ATPase subunit